jgi:hypothetical protein
MPLKSLNMKKVLFSIFFFAVLIAGASAQKADCSKSCGSKSASASSCQAKAGTATTASVDEAAAAAKLASTDKTIESRTCPVSGTVSYFRKEAQPGGGVKQVDLQYDATSNTFVNVAPSTMKGQEGCGSASKSASSGKSCCAGKATNASGNNAAGCCSGKAQKTATKSN